MMTTTESHMMTRAKAKKFKRSSRESLESEGVIMRGPSYFEDAVLC